MHSLILVNLYGGGHRLDPRGERHKEYEAEMWLCVHLNVHSCYVIVLRILNILFCNHDIVLYGSGSQS